MRRNTRRGFVMFSSASQLASSLDSVGNKCAPMNGKHSGATGDFGVSVSYETPEMTQRAHFLPLSIVEVANARAVNLHIQLGNGSKRLCNIRHRDQMRDRVAAAPMPACGSALRRAVEHSQRAECGVQNIGSRRLRRNRLQVFLSQLRKRSIAAHQKHAQPVADSAQLYKRSRPGNQLHRFCEPIVLVE